MNRMESTDEKDKEKQTKSKTTAIQGEGSLKWTSQKMKCKMYQKI